MTYTDNYYHDDPDREISIEPTSRRSKLGVMASVLMFVLGGLFIQSTLAGNISINSSGTFEFGQGRIMTAACAAGQNLIVTPRASFVNASNAGAFYLGSITVSNIPTSCYGTAFKINAYDPTQSTPLALYNTTSTDVTVGNNSGSFVSQGNQSGLDVTTNSSSSFTVSFANPVATSSNFVKLTIQSWATSFEYAPTRGIQFPSLSGISLSTGLNEANDFTIEGWVRSSDWSPIYALVPYVGNACYAVVIWSTSSTSWNASLDCAPNFITYTMPGGSSMANNQWIYWAYVKDSNGQSMFVNGAKLTGVSTSNGGAASLPLTATSDQGAIGEWYAWRTATYSSNNGVIGELRLSNIARVASTATSFSPSYITGGKPIAQLASDANTVMLLRTPVSGSTFTDSSGNQTLTVVTSINGPGTPVNPVIVNFG